ncbi:hypothetical protein SAMN04487783_1735 [Agrococcus baldri]|uniref:Uncharacterized protein n=1 Tax=Agrococcus baldri TaxID=153730 RepID=A0AA94HMY7_9MICO|nr:hypothetical protein [Agrococcus baldri]SFS13950.1 hypothetical protein SAMN04487783_1735 [Agrococcus baldri]
MTRAMWVWVHADAPPDPGALGAFAARERVTEAFVSVPLAGPDPVTRACAAALREHGVRVAALGGDPSWAEPPARPGDDAVGWMRRATADGMFDAVHLDIEPWDRDDWVGGEERLLSGLARAVRDVTIATRMPVEVDMAPWIAAEHPSAFAAIARAADGVTLMAYRDRAPAILALSAAARALLAEQGTRWRLGVETTAGLPSHVTFADDGRAVLERELAAAVDALDRGETFAGVAVHDFAAWMRLPA